MDLSGLPSGRPRENPGPAIDAADLRSLQAGWEVTAGSTTVEELTDQRAVGRLEDFLVVRHDDGGSRSIDGTFDLPLFSEAEGVGIMECFLARATRGTC